MMQKLRIRIKRPLGEVTVTRKVERDGVTVIVWKKRGELPEWKFTFDRDSVYPTKKTFLGGKVETVDAFPFATEAVKYDYLAKEEDQAIYDRYTEEKLVNAKVLEGLGEEEKQKAPALLWIIFILSVGSFLLSLLTYWRSVGR